MSSPNQVPPQPRTILFEKQKYTFAKQKLHNKIEVIFRILEDEQGSGLPDLSALTIEATCGCLSPNFDRKARTIYVQMHLTQDIKAAHIYVYDHVDKQKLEAAILTIEATTLDEYPKPALPVPSF